MRNIFVGATHSNKTIPLEHTGSMAVVGKYAWKMVLILE